MELSRDEVYMQGDPSRGHASQSNNLLPQFESTRI